jgi:hypothetical protein
VDNDAARRNYNDLGIDAMPKAKTATTTLTVCEQYVRDNPEVLSGFTLNITGGELANLRVRACRGPVRVLVKIDREGGGAQRTVADATNVTDQWRDIALQMFASLDAGKNYLLTWVIDGPADDWQVVSELTLDRTVHYRHLKKRRSGVMNAEILNLRVRP